MALLERKGPKAIRALPVHKDPLAQRARLGPLVRRVAVVQRLFQLSRWSGRLRLLRFRILRTDRLAVINLILLTSESLRFGQVSRARITPTTVPCSTSFRLRLAAISLSETFRLAVDRRKTF